MHPFRSFPDAIDRISCGRCGRPAWDHCVSLSYDEYQSGEEANACNRFALPDFTPIYSQSFEAHAQAN